VSDYWQKAEEAADAARILIAAGSCDAAVNRAYYAIFDLAKAVLKEIDPKLIDAKNHATILRRFSGHVVKPGIVDVEAGRILTGALQVRLVADYEETSLLRPEAEKILDLMTAFFSSVRSRRRVSP
jgi:uncharacterized protein (UPF0332 family)